jgi:hypothetical protein
MLKLIRKHKRDYWCYSISKKKCEKEKEKEPLNEWKHHNVGMISNLNYKKKPSLHLSFLFLSSSPPSISFFLLFLFPSFPIH